MLEMRSPLAPLGAAARFECPGIILEEDVEFTLTQVAGEAAALKKAFGKIPGKVGIVAEHEGAYVFKTGPKQLWIVGEAPPVADGIHVTPLSSSRARIVLSGAKARDVLASAAAIDFDRRHFKPGHFAMTGIHHTPVLIHCIGDDSFHIYAMRSFALAVWEWLGDAASGP